MNEKIKEDLQYPLIVKPGIADNCLGITNSSVVRNKKELKEQIDKILVGMKRPVLVEEYIEGDEYEVCILGNNKEDLQVLPLSRTIFNKLPPKYWHIFTYEAKWLTNPDYEKIIIQQPPKNIGKKLESIITEIALDTYAILHCHDYGRVEIRVDKEKNPYVIELDPNPFLNKDACLPSVARLIGLEYGNLLEGIISLALGRYKNKPLITA